MSTPIRGRSEGEEGRVSWLGRRTRSRAVRQFLYRFSFSFLIFSFLITLVARRGMEEYTIALTEQRGKDHDEAGAQIDVDGLDVGDLW